MVLNVGCLDFKNTTLEDNTSHSPGPIVTEEKKFKIKYQKHIKNKTLDAWLHF